MTDELTEIQDANLMGLAQRTVGFMVEAVENEKVFLTPAGSGTIISIQEVVFFVTAGHVAKAVMSSSKAGIYGVVSPLKKLRPIEFDPRQCQAEILWSGEESMEGPDIAAILLPPSATAQVAQRRIVYNLDRRAALKGEIQPMADLILCGFPSEAKARNVSIEEWQRHDMMTLSVVGGTKSNIVKTEDGFDRFDFEGVYMSEPPPETFRGVSGGGLWYIDADDPATIPMLAGVAYYQGDKRADGNRLITCAGSHTLYAQLLQRAAQRWVP